MFIPRLYDILLIEVTLGISKIYNLGYFFIIDLGKGDSMLATLVIGSGIVYTGYSAYRSRQSRAEQPEEQNKNFWKKMLDDIFNTKNIGTQQIDTLESSSHQLNDMVVVDQTSTLPILMDSVDLYIEQSRTLERQLILATTALGCTAVGSFVITPLYFVSVPILIYMGIPSAQGAYDELTQNHHPGFAMLETGLLLIALAQGTYMIGAIGFAAYYFGQLKDLLPSVLSIEIPIEMVVWRNGQKLQILIDEVEKGDLFEVTTSDQIYFDGVIIDGEAVVDLKWATGEEELVTKKAGETILATTVISIGKLVVECR